MRELYAVRSGAVLMTDGYELYNGIVRAHQLVRPGLPGTCTTRPHRGRASRGQGAAWAAPTGHSVRSLDRQAVRS